MPRRSPVNGRPSPSPLAASSGAPRACAGRALTPVPASCLRRRVSVALRRDLGAPTSGRMRGSRARGGAPGHPRTGHGPSAGPGGTGNRRHARRGDSAPRRGRGWPGGCCVFLVLSVRRRPRIKRRSTCSPHQRADGGRPAWQGTWCETSGPGGRTPAGACGGRVPPRVPRLSRPRAAGGLRGSHPTARPKQRARRPEQRLPTRRAPALCEGPARAS